MASAPFTPFHRGGDGPPQLCLHGFADTWRTWELVLPLLEREHDVLAPTLAGHAGGPPIHGDVDENVLADAVERALDDAGWETAHVAGSSLGGYVALQLAARGRARSVVALAPSGGFAEGDEGWRETLSYHEAMLEAVRAAAPHAEAILASPKSRRRATLNITVRYEHIPVGAGDKPRLVALNKADLYDGAAADAEAPAPMLGDTVPVSALTGFGMDSLRLALSAVLADLWEDVDVRLPYQEGELLARIRERGSVEVTYGETDVRIVGRVAPSLASELRAAAARRTPEPVGAAD